MRQANSTVDRAIADLAAGKMVVLCDSGEEGEGDVAIAAEFATAQNLNFMIKQAHGPIFLVLSDDRCAELALKPIGRRGDSNLAGVAMVSIEARHGVTTGVSAADRARTIQVAIDPSMGPVDLVQPGHVLPLRAHPGGVLDHPGRVEAAVDLALCAGLRPAAVLCQVIRDDGHTARAGDLRQFADMHGLGVLEVPTVVTHRMASTAPPDHDGRSVGTLLREVMGHFATGVSVVTARDPDGRPVGTTANAISSVSLCPALVLACLATDSETLEAVRLSRRFAINVLGSEQRAHSERFAAKGAAARADEVDFHDHEIGVPVIPGALATIACEVDAIHAAGDHEIVVGAVRSLARSEGGREPLLFYRGAYSRVHSERGELAA